MDFPLSSGLPHVLAPAVLSAVALAVAGHLVRRATPALVGLRERSLPFSWPWLELLGFLVGFLLGRAAGSPPAEFFWPVAALSVLLLAACATDYLVQLIPDRITFGGGLLGIGLSALFPGPILAQPLHDVLLAAWGLGPSGALPPAFPVPPAVAAAVLAAAGALVGFALLELVRRAASLAAGLEAMGMGDSKLLLMIGAFLGPFGALATLALSFLVGVVHGGLAAAITRKPHAPFGPALAAGAWFYLFGTAPMAWMWDRFQGLVLSLSFGWLAGGYAVMLTCVVLLVLRVRRRAAEYEAIIEADYREVDEKLEGGEAVPEETSPEAGESEAVPHE